ncbi:hypothetical protein DFH09DRAFT_1475451 [Mycena vulgaris]|nr:hypothetical protein DFH09DRAFT_1475451 [Mycena vulgaris]
MFLRSLVSRAAPHPLTAVLVERSVAPKSMGGALGIKNINGNALAPRVEAMPDPTARFIDELERGKEKNLPRSNPGSPSRVSHQLVIATTGEVKSISESYSYSYSPTPVAVFDIARGIRGAVLARADHITPSNYTCTDYDKGYFELLSDLNGIMPHPGVPLSIPRVPIKHQTDALGLYAAEFPAEDVTIEFEAELAPYLLYIVGQMFVVRGRVDMVLPSSSGTALQLLLGLVLFNVYDGNKWEIGGEVDKVRKLLEDVVRTIYGQISPDQFLEGDVPHIKLPSTAMVAMAATAMTKTARDTAGYTRNDFSSRRGPRTTGPRVSTIGKTGPEYNSKGENDTLITKMDYRGYYQAQPNLLVTYIASTVIDADGTRYGLSPGFRGGFSAALDM